MHSAGRSKTYLALIPARGGSKRLPGKNLMEIGGKSLIWRALESAEGAGAHATVCLSTDDEQLAQEGRRYGAVVPFMRPAELASDTAQSFDVVRHAVNWYADKGQVFDGVIVLQPTSPLRARHHVHEAIKRFEGLEADGVVSVCRAEHPPEWTSRLDSNLSMESFGKKLQSYGRSQDYQPAYRLNGAIYIFNTYKLLSNDGFFYSDRTYGYEMSLADSVDIDNEEDYLLARFWAERKGEL